MLRHYQRGRLPARHDLRTMRGAIAMATHLAALGPPPAAPQDYLTPLQQALAGQTVGGGGAYGMYLNDRLGDCVCADTAHEVLLRTANAGTGLVVPTCDDVEKLYEAVGGYVPGNASTDQGCDETSMEQYVQSTGFCGQKSAGSGVIDPSNLDHVKWGIQLFGCVRMGVVVDQQMESQFDAGQPWTTPAAPNDPNAGGHDMLLFSWDAAAGVWSAFTWGGIAYLSDALIASAAFFDEAHGSVWPDFITATGSAPNGLDLQQLLADLPAVAELGGKLVTLVPQPGGFQSLKPCQYGKWTDGTWYGCTPNGEHCNLGAHQITEHPDGSISAVPSIVVSVLVGPPPKTGPDNRQKKILWHGWLTRGVWTEC